MKNTENKNLDKDRFKNVRDKNAMVARLNASYMTESENIRIERWTPDDNSQLISYVYSETPFGEVLIGATNKGICFLGFTGGESQSAINDLRRRFPHNEVIEGFLPYHAQGAMQIVNPHLQLPVKLHLKGSQFQFDIWKKLSQIPFGGLTTYARLGNNPKEARAVGTAVGSNPVGILIPCHRVIHSDGSFNGYFWGTELKEKILSWEAAKIDFPQKNATFRNRILQSNTI